MTTSVDLPKNGSSVRLKLKCAELLRVSPCSCANTSLIRHWSITMYRGSATKTTIFGQELSYAGDARTFPPGKTCGGVHVPSSHYYLGGIPCRFPGIDREPPCRFQGIHRDSHPGNNDHWEGGGRGRERLKELEYLHEKDVWAKISRRRAKELGIRVLGASWIDITTG